MIVGAVAATLLLCTGVWVWSRRDTEPRQMPVPLLETPVTVEVLNAIGVDGLARAVTMRLRDQGLDFTDLTVGS